MRCITTYVNKSPDGTIIFLSDSDGPVSMTNDAEAVVAMCHNHHPGLRIVYRDTDGCWDEMIHNNGRFLSFRQYDGWLPDV